MSTTATPENGAIEVGPGPLKMTFSSVSGQLTRVFSSKTGVSCFCQTIITIVIAKLLLCTIRIAKYPVIKKNLILYKVASH